MKFTKKFFKSATAAVLSSAIFLGSTCFQTASAEEGALFRNINQILEEKRGTLEKFNANELHHYALELCDWTHSRINAFECCNTDFVGILEELEDRFNLYDEIVELNTCCQTLAEADYHSFEYRSMLVKAFIHAEIIKKILYEALEVSGKYFNNKLYIFENIDHKLKHVVLFLYNALSDPKDLANFFNMRNENIDRLCFWGYMS